MVKNGDAKFYRTQELVDKDFIVNNTLKADADINAFQEIVDYYETSNLQRAIKSFKNNWIPLPYFKDNSINKDVMHPTDWVRVYFDCDDEYKKIKIVLAIDTTLAKNILDRTGPQLSLNPDENIFKIHTNKINSKRIFQTKTIFGKG